MRCLLFIICLLKNLKYASRWVDPDPDSEMNRLGNEMFKGVFWLPIDQGQVLTTWSGGLQNGLVLNLRSCDVTALQASKSDINIQ